ncbi:chromosome segregation SMC family protein [Candidatus Margulisiibacteriota bacterium]
MFLKSLILRGFKTFSDLTEIEFAQDARITAIVGPNGCGKSNLLDAARWALGEDNPRELRVANLSDIIFAGTTARKLLSLAEVSLIFDNSSGRLPLAFAEISIKRRTFREGESEFFINKNHCRLKDIRNLLLDTGLGEGTYSIITQGQVDAILSSKGDERRAVFEEAAGINKYKTRKLAAEKKLIAAEQNILRINDLKIEVGEHIITLEEQAKKAREYLDVQARVKELDIGLSRRLLANILEKKDALQTELARIKEESQVKKEAEQKEVDELATLKEAARNIEREIEEISVKLDTEKDRLRDIELDFRFTDGEVQRETRALGDISRKEGALQTKIAEAQKVLEASAQEFNFSEALLRDSLSDLLQSLSKLVGQISSFLAFFDEGKNISLTLGGSAEKEEAYKLKLEMLQEETKRLAEEKERLNFALQAHKAQLESLVNKRQTAQAKQNLLDLLAQKKKEKENLAQKISGLEEKIRIDDQSERQAFSAETSLEIALAKLEGEMTAIRDRFSLEYNLSLDELINQPHEVKNISKTRGEIETGKARLRELEPVNLLAIDEHEKEKERLAFIDAQLSDLSSARENLGSLISELDLKAEQDFLRTMQQISEIFSETFAKLFAGGESKISLTPGKPPLEAEIEISVRPSGRKWLPLPLLSGGERSLSAIAILFSLLRIRPSPFCFLDEVDAALDDANIGRFTKMLKEFSQDSQILVITHNKNTMAVADNIYGITMEDPGVSKVISMKLAEVAA